MPLRKCTLALWSPLPPYSPSSSSSSPPHPPFVPFVFIPPLLLWSYQLTCCCVNPLVTLFAFALINFSMISHLPSFPNDLGGWSWLSLSLFPLKPVIFPLYGYVLCIRKIPNMTKQDSVLQTAWHGSKMHKFNPDEGLWNKHIQHSGHSSHITWLKGLYLPIRPFEKVQQFIRIRNLFTSEYTE